MLSGSDQSASPVSPSSSAASPSFVNQSNQADGFRGGHNGNNAPDPDSDDESIPDLLSNDSDSSPDAFPGHANGTTSSASGQSTSTSHAQAHGQPYDQSPESDSDMSDTSPQGRRWSNGTGAMPAAGNSAHAAMHGNPLYGVSPASQASHVDAESASADSADEAESDSFQHPYNDFQQPQTKQSLETAAAYFKQGFELLYTRDWRQAVRPLYCQLQTFVAGATVGLHRCRHCIRRACDASASGCAAVVSDATTCVTPCAKSLHTVCSLCLCVQEALGSFLLY